MLPVILLIGGLVLGAFLMWMYCKAAFAKEQVSPTVHAVMQQQLADATTALAVSKDHQQNLQSAFDKADALARQYQITAQEKAIAQAQSEAAFQTLNKTFEELNVGYKALLIENRGDKNQLASLQSKVDAATERLLNGLRDREELGEALKVQFAALAGQVLDSKTKTFNQQQETKLTDLLSPFKQQIQDFQQQVTEKFTNEGKEKAALQREIELLSKASGMLSKQATDLTEALRGSTKKQGDWGEGILEGILEYCGLTEGIHYFTQASSRTEEGITIRPDVLVNLPGNRKLVIDSKVSLTHYWDLCATTDVEIQKTCLALINNSLRQHIDSLYKKPYNEVAGTPDYLIMFVPVEAAYITALQHDPGLWQFAYTRGIVLISPTNLIPFMRVVQNLWDRDDKYKNAEAIAEKAGKLYDKLVGFISNYLKIGAELETAQKAYNEGLGQLSTGKDNLIRQAEKMKALNISNKKELPASLAEHAMLESELHIPDQSTLTTENTEE